MPKKPKIDCATIFPRIATIIREDGRDRFLDHWEIAQRLQDDEAAQNLATPNKQALCIASKAVGLFSQHYTMREKEIRHGPVQA